MTQLNKIKLIWMFKSNSKPILQDIFYISYQNSDGKEGKQRQLKSAAQQSVTHICHIFCL